MADKYVYPYSVSEAKNRNELALWRESWRENIACAKDIRQSISEHYHDNCLDSECVGEMLEKYGFKRVNFVLANTIQYKDYDGRFSHDNKEWAKRFFIPDNGEHRCQFVCDAHPCLVDGFVSGVRKEYQALGLFGSAHCEPDDAAQNYEGRVLVLSPDTLKEDCWSQQNQLWLCTGGFGSRPNARGRAVFATCLGDGEQTRWNRENFVGVLKDELLPDWAKEKLEELQTPQEPTLGGQTM